MRVGKCGLRQLELQTGMAECDSREFGEGALVWPFLIWVDFFYLHVMNNYYFISTNPRTKTRKKKLERVENPGKIFKHTTGVLKLQNS
jgi:hypothetical protein